MPGAWLLLVIVAVIVLFALSFRRRKQEDEFRANLDGLTEEHARFAQNIRHRLEFLEQRLSEIASALGQSKEATQPDVTTKRGEVAEDRAGEQVPESEKPAQAAVRSLDEREGAKPVLEAPAATTVPSPATKPVLEEVTPLAPGPAEWTSKPPTKAPTAAKAQLPQVPGPVAGRKVARTYLSRAADWVQKSTTRADEKPIDWEALIGGSWLNIIGIVVLVVGMVLFSRHSLTQFGPTGKIGTGLGVSFFLLVCGVLLERVKRYRLLAWTFIGGGWATRRPGRKSNADWKSRVTQTHASFKIDELVGFLRAYCV